VYYNSKHRDSKSRFMASIYPFSNTYADDTYTVPDVAPGRILWLPLQEELPEGAVRRAYGKGAVEDGIYQHPVVVVARFADVVHFQLVSNSLPG
jgi:hypothetical protein